MGLGRRVVVVVASAAMAASLAMLVIEVWVRLRWDETKGTPGFFLTDAARGQRLTPNYDGWFAGVPVRINALGFRDRRDYSLAKPSNTIRIVVLGDSVTFGHGTLDDTTYPYLLEQRLRAWRGDVNWEVWNLGVPGYNTRQELTYLQEVGPAAKPDVVVVGFYPNDFTGDNRESPPPAAWRRAAANMLATIQRHVYSYEFYKRAILTLRWRVFTSEPDRLRIEHLTAEQQLREQSGSVADASAQRLTEVEYLNDPGAAAFTCPGAGTSGAAGADTVAARLRSRAPDLADWFDAVEDFQRLHREGQYRIVFFVNMAPIVCASEDRFVDGGRLTDDDALLEVLGRGTPAVSSTRAFLQYRPSQMPAAGDHAIGNSNAVKADVLFRHLRDHVLPPIVPGPPAQ